MRCKQDQMVILSARNLRNKNCEKFIGQIHKTSELFHHPHAGLLWLFDPPIWMGEGRQLGWADQDCDPIEDQPGDDETLAWKPVPSTINRTDDDLVSGLWEVLAGDGAA